MSDGAVGATYPSDSFVVSDRGKVLSFVNFPVMLFGCPFLVAALLPDVGRTALLLGIAALFVFLMPVLLWLVTEPQPAANTSLGPRLQGGTATKLLRSPAFWLLSPASASWPAWAPLSSFIWCRWAPEAGMTLAAASGLLAVYAGAGLLGTPLFGWLADRIGPRPHYCLVWSARYSFAWRSLVPKVWLFTRLPLRSACAAHRLSRYMARRWERCLAHRR